MKLSETLADAALFVSARMRMALCALLAVWLLKAVALGAPDAYPSGGTGVARAPIPEGATARAP